MTAKRAYFKYWGKARKEGEEGAPYHLLPYHCLDVAAVGQVLLARHHHLKARLLDLSGLDEGSFTKWVLFYLAIHDLGKFSESFQNLRPDLLARLQGRASNKAYSLRHDSLGHALWTNQARSWVLGLQNGGRRSRVVQGLDYWALAVMGHHGLPPKKVGNDFDFFSANDQEVALAFVQDVAELLLGDKGVLTKPSNLAGKKFSWWLSGFAVLCDWLGSNAEVFPFCGEAQPLSDYWPLAIERAEIAVAQAELLPATPAPLKSLQTLFSPYLKAATPLQALCSKLPLKQGAQLFILEDVTGAGKTEAATLLLHRLLASGAAEGVYFALPTMATANAMYGRMAKVYGQLYEGVLQPSLVLAHGARELSSFFRQSIINTPSTALENYGDETVPASAHCSAWLADNRKKALLAEVGVGTIDQSLLAVLPSRHQSLRMLGLLGKVLVVDEVHACDAYMNELLCAVLKVHASAGGHAILLSATLPTQQRQKLLNAFNEGAGTTKKSVKKTEHDAYPLLTHAGSGQLDEVIVATRESVKREVAVEHLANSEAVLNKIVRALEQGRCVCWIRNTVDDARESYEQLQQRLPEGVVDLFHARYAMADRLAIEQRVLHHFGADSTPELRRGRVLVATQVVEQSLDLDFDLMITDLAPIDLIIQRAGRLCRHARDENGRRIEGKDRRGKPVLLIHGPDPDGDVGEGWFKDFFKRASGVYPNHGQLWLTAKLLLDQGGFQMPADARNLIEGVYGDDVAYPDMLEASVWDAEGDNSAKRGLADLNALDLSAGYGGGFENGWWEEANTPTRLGEEMSTVYLTRWDGEQLIPWADNSDFPWPNSAVQIRRALIADEYNANISEAVLERARQRLPAKGKWGVLLAMEEGGQNEWLGKVIDERKRERVVRYSLVQGLSVEQASP